MNSSKNPNSDESQPIKKAKPKSVKKKPAKKIPAKKQTESKSSAKTVKKKKKSEADVTTVKAAQESVVKHRVLPKKTGMGVAVKFAIFIVALLALVVSAGQYWSLHLARERVSNEIDNQGILLCHTLIGAGKHFLDGLETKADSSAEERKRLGDLLVDAAATNPELEDILWNILFTQPSEKGGEQVLFGESVEMSYFSIQEMKGVTRSETYLDNENLRVRQYSMKAPDSPYRIEVFLKASRLDKLEAEMQRNSLITTAASLVLGILGAMILSSKIASPIQALSKDMLKMASGDLGHQTRVKSSDEIGVLAQTFNLMSKDLEVSHKLALEKLEQDRDLALAHDVQESLLPRHIPKVSGYQVKPFYRSAKDVGGDYYDIVPVDRDRIAYVVADVAGKGTQGAMIMAMTRGITRTYLRGVPSPALALSRVNRSLAHDLKPGSFVTAMCAILNFRTGELSIASAGHNPLVLVKHQKKTCEMINPAGIALGFDKGTLFNKIIKDQTIQLRVGDRVVLYTDGVVEAMSPEREEYGEGRFEAFCVANASKSSDDFVTHLVGALDEHKGKAPQHDDITIVALRKMA